jgi:rubrerythrin
VDWEEFFKLMIIDERAAKAKYETALAKVTDAELRAVLERLRDEEAFHADYLQDNWARLAAKLSRS